MSSSIVVVDDVRVPTANFPHEGEHVRVFTNAYDAIHFLKSLQEGRDVVSCLYLDHDLGMSEAGESWTIMPVVDVLVEAAFAGRPLPVAEVVVHSSNPVGRANVVAALTSPRIAGAYPVHTVDAISAGLACPQ